jgi:cation diffusion facilitator family transporter
MGHSHHHTIEPTTDAGDNRYREARKVTLVGSVVDLLLGVAKISAGYVGSSQALIADGMHSLSDLATDVVVLYAMKHGSREADEEHPYGHGRIETLATVVLGTALIGVALGIAWDAVLRLRHPDLLLHPGWLALSIAAISIAAKEIIYHYTLRVARRLKSNLLRANAWHSRSDAISSVIVVIGILGAMGGLNYLDAVAAIGVALMVAKIGASLAWHSTRELIDTAMEAEQVEQIRTTIIAVDGVQALHMLRTRRMGSHGLVDVHILVNPRVSVSEGHRISEGVRIRIMEEVDAVTDVMVHIDPEDDERATPSSDLPLRREVQTLLARRWAGVEAAQYIDETILHYLDGKIHLEVSLPLTRMKDIREARTVARELTRLALEAEGGNEEKNKKGKSNLAEVRVYFH